MSLDYILFKGVLKFEFCFVCPAIDQVGYEFKKDLSISASQVLSLKAGTHVQPEILILLP